jgi:hypothetical protein
MINKYHGFDRYYWTRYPYGNGTSCLERDLDYGLISLRDFNTMQLFEDLLRTMVILGISS